MALYECSKCGVIENTALTNFWKQQLNELSVLCSMCDPAIRCWHGQFPRENFADGAFEYTESGKPYVQRRVSNESGGG